jgi:hypothetical protein
VRSAIRFHLDTFGEQLASDESPVRDAFVMDAELA